MPAFNREEWATAVGPGESGNSRFSSTSTQMPPSLVVSGNGWLLACCHGTTVITSTSGELDRILL